MEDLCYDCGHRLAHIDSKHLCRKCGEKGGEPYLYCTKIDHDKLRAKLGNELAQEIINECMES